MIHLFERKLFSKALSTGADRETKKKKKKNLFKSFLKVLRQSWSEHIFVFLSKKKNIHSTMSKHDVSATLRPLRARSIKWMNSVERYLIYLWYYDWGLLKRFLQEVSWKHWDAFEKFFIFSSEKKWFEWYSFISPLTSFQSFHTWQKFDPDGTS